jgi:4-diphosphocytidyl-2-C-methyl-D-erythritol kinase
MQVRCPAKINRFLSVGPPDPTGMHPIRTIFQAISLADELVIEPSSADSIHTNWNALPHLNTITKALHLAREYTDVPPLTIRLDKQIPSEAGMGGGSTDAAGLLRALMRLTNGRLRERDAHEIATAVGKDVPFFLVGGMARATGYGDILEPLEDGSEETLVIACPGAKVSTANAYAALDAIEREWRDFPAQLEPYNDFERVAPSESLDLKARLEALGGSDCLLCGSGSAVFGCFPDKPHADRAADRLRSEGYDQVWVVRTLNREESLWMSSY